MQSSRFHYLLEKFKQQQLSSAEHQELLDFANLGDDDSWAMMMEKLTEIEYNNTPGQNFITNELKAILAVDKTLPSSHGMLRWMKYAAAILLVLGVAAYIFVVKRHPEKTIVAAAPNKEPGKDKATLILSDGRQVVLENANNQNIADGNVSIENTNGILSYSAASASETNSIGINTMTTPRGGQYQLVLPDGSKVWLNSASSLKYPVVFSGENRTVELSGEAYFDIKGNKKMPFIVKTQKAEVLVLGTAFNINSYADEPAFSTTLINGSVKVLAGNNAKTILPGQQAQLLNSQSNSLEIKNDVDINQIIAWQKGIFKFDGVTIDVIARQLSRWYDVDVRTNISDNKNFRFNGGINKKTPLKGLLKMLELNGVKNKWDNNIITLYLN